MLTYPLLSVLLVLQAPPTLAELDTRGLRALRSGSTELAVKIAHEIGDGYPNSFSAQMACGGLLLRAGDAAAGLKAFDRAVELQPKQTPYLWQRGIAQYYAGQYEQGRKQFELHRDVNPHDVENALWHFMCVARLENIQAARKSILPAPGDPRIPMKEIYDLYAGTGSQEQVIQAMNAPASSDAAKESSHFYGEFYLGVYEDLMGNPQESYGWLKLATLRNSIHYMGDIARVHRQRVKAQLDEKTP